MLEPLIHQAALKCDVEGLRMCLSREAKYERFACPVDAREPGGHTALHLLCGSNSAYAAMYVETGERNAETVEACFHLLREAGADLNARDNAGFTALHHVAYCSRASTGSYEVGAVPGVRPVCLKLASLLLRHGVDVNARDAESIVGTSPLHEAVFCSAMTALLIKAGADVNLLDNGHRTPLYTALYHGTHCHDGRVRETLPTLLRAGAEISNHIRTALDAYAGPHSSTHAEGEVIFLYFQKVIDAGGFKKYAQAHLATLTKTFAPKFPVLPPEMVRHILTFGFHAGFY